MWMARFLPVLFLLLFVNGPVPLSGELDDTSSTDGQAVHQPCTRRIVGGARDLRISHLERPLQTTRQDLRPRIVEVSSLSLISEPVCKIPDRTSSFDSPSEED
jgi:hypothetical protein